jgi:hypothetical protein
MNTDNINNCHTCLTKPFGQRAMFYFDYLRSDSCRHPQIQYNKIRNALRSTKKKMFYFAVSKKIVNASTIELRAALAVKDKSLSTVLYIESG